MRVATGPLCLATCQRYLSLITTSSEHHFCDTHRDAATDVATVRQHVQADSYSEKGRRGAFERERNIGMYDV